MVTRILSGMRPTGRLHIGHMVGALDNWVDLQGQYDSFYFVADWHAMTTETDTRSIRPDSIEMAKDWFAAGIDPDRSTIFVQSQVPEHAELHLALSMLNTLPRLERVPSFKGLMDTLLKKEEDVELTEKEIAKARSQISYGFLGYPVLQAADILIYKADGVPVGEDQVPHLELTREIARAFNKTYGEVFPEPEALLTVTPRILGTDGRKMSKSYGNTILPTDDLEVTRKNVRKMVTDPQRIHPTDKGDPHVCSVYDLHCAYSPEDGQLAAYQECVGGKRGCGDCKQEVAEVICKKYEGYRERRAEWDNEDGEEEIVDLLRQGSAQARVTASATMNQVKDHLLVLK